MTRYFSRRCGDAQTVADLTSETIVRAAAGFAGFDPGRGSARAWLLGIAGHVYAQYCAQASNGRAATARLAGLVELSTDEIDELSGRIDAQRAGRELLERCARLSALERAAVELVDLGGVDAEGGRNGAWRFPGRAAHALVTGAGATTKGG